MAFQNIEFYFSQSYSYMSCTLDKKKKKKKTLSSKALFKMSIRLYALVFVIHFGNLRSLKIVMSVDI